MVTRLLYLFLLLPTFLFSGEFTASVSRNPVSLNETFTLTLALKDASPRGSPYIAPLKTIFHIHSQQQSSNTTVMNGHVSTSLVWKISLAAQKDGEITIPSLNIDTSEGTLSSNPIKLRVEKGNLNKSPSSDGNDVTLTSDVSNANPYKSEPIFYTMRLLSKVDLVNVRIQKFNIDDAIVEANGEPKIDKKFVNGVKMNVIDFSYLITPLKAGKLKIPSISIQGATPVRRKPQMRSLFDDEFDFDFHVDSFFMMSDQLKSFALTTDELVLNVEPPVAGINPWLPAKSLKIEESWNESQTLKVGEPITRSFNIQADGILSSQLPSLNDLQTNESSFKIYADKPETGDDIKNGRVHSFRKEQYTLIPQKPGTLTLPEISVAWWNAAKREKVVTRIPSRILQIMPAVETAQANVELGNEGKYVDPSTSTTVVQRDPIIYALVGGMALLLLLAVLWGMALQKKITRLTEKPVEIKVLNKRETPLKKTVNPVAPKEKPPAKDKKEKLPDLNPT